MSAILDTPRRREHDRSGPSRPAPGPGRPSRRSRGPAVTVLLDLVAPSPSTTGCARGASIYLALLAGAVTPALHAAVQLIRDRRIDVLAAGVLGMLLASTGVALIAGSPRFLLAKEGLLTAAWGVWMCLRTRFRTAVTPVRPSRGTGSPREMLVDAPHRLRSRATPGTREPTTPTRPPSSETSSQPARPTAADLPLLPAAAGGSQAPEPADRTKDADDAVMGRAMASHAALSPRVAGDHPDLGRGAAHRRALRVIMAYTLPVDVVSGLGGALWPATFIALQIVTNIYFTRSGMWHMLHGESVPRAQPVHDESSTRVPNVTDESRARERSSHP